MKYRPWAVNTARRPRAAVPWFVLLVQCTCFGGCDDELQFYPSKTTDAYRQDPLRQVDILLVIDSSGSMVEEQAKLAENFQSFISAFTTAEVDYHIGVITTDVDNLTVAGILQGETPIITPNTPDQAEVFAANVQVGTGGSGYEMGLEAAWLALTEPRISQDNAGFYRASASLSIVVFSDEDDLSPHSVDDYLNYFSQLKGTASYRDHSLMNISAVVGDVPYGCEADDGSGEAGAGTRYVDAADRTEGVFNSICSEDFAPIVQALGLDLSGLKDEFPLSRCARPETLEVKVAGRLETLNVTYSYLPDRKSIRFASNWVPEPGDEITIHYEFYTEDTQTCPAE